MIPKKRPCRRRRASGRALSRRVGRIGDTHARFAATQTFAVKTRGAHTAADVVVKARAILSEALLRARLDVGYANCFAMLMPVA
jgi:hypothetical protein